MLTLAHNQNPNCPKHVDIICDGDPVRPNIPNAWRVEKPNKFTYFESTPNPFRVPEKNWIDAVCCVALLDKIPTTEEELMSYGKGDIAVFYTVWSTSQGKWIGRQIPKPKGQAKKLLNMVMEEMSQKSVTRCVTLSPKTEIATKFHLDNGAILLSENELTLNFEYKKEN